MFVVTVTPLVRGAFKDTLTYWSPKEILLGSILQAPLKNREIPALVTEIKPLGEAKSLVKSSSFVLRKIQHGSGKMLFLPGFIDTAQKVSSLHFISLGEVLSSFVPKIILEKSETLGVKIKRETNTGNQMKRFLSEKLVLQTGDEDRLGVYKSLVREEFARKKSVFLCAPTVREVKRLGEILSRGIENYTFILHGDLSQKETLKLWSKASTLAHPVLIIGTPLFVSLPREDCKTIIIENEISRNYRSIRDPHLDTRVFIENLAESRGMRLVLGGFLLRTDTIQRHDERELLELIPLQFRHGGTLQGSVIDMRRYRNERPYVYISNELKALIELTIREHKSIFIFTGRRGLAPTTSCADCGTLVRCSCGAPFVLHDSKKPYFLCHKCGNGRALLPDDREKCTTCGSWRLSTLGAGIEEIEKKLKEAFPEIPLFRIDSDSVKKEGDAIKIAQQFYKKPGSILLGTEMAVPYIESPVSASALVFVDSLFTVPDFRMNEKMFDLFARIRTLTKDVFLIQTLEPEKPLYQNIARGEFRSFYIEELKERKEFGYPPFGTLIKGTTMAPKEIIDKESERLEHLFKNYEPRVYRGNTLEKNKVPLHFLLKLPGKRAPDEDLVVKIRELKNHYRIEQNPDTIL